MTKQEQKDYRIGIANLVLDTFCPGTTLYWGSRELRMTWGNSKTRTYDFPARLRTDGSWPAFGYNVRPSGGTAFQALAQLIRYVRELHRLPISTWQYWAGDAVQLGNERTIAWLRQGGYDDPKKTGCIFCGTTAFKKGLDWWSLGKNTGPACLHECELVPTKERYPR